MVERREGGGWQEEERYLSVVSCDIGLGQFGVVNVKEEEGKVVELGYTDDSDGRT